MPEQPSASCLVELLMVGYRRRDVQYPLRRFGGYQGPSSLNGKWDSLNAQCQQLGVDGPYDARANKSSGLKPQWTSRWVHPVVMPFGGHCRRSVSAGGRPLLALTNYPTRFSRSLRWCHRRFFRSASRTQDLVFQPHGPLRAGTSTMTHKLRAGV